MVKKFCDLRTLAQNKHNRRLVEPAVVLGKGLSLADLPSDAGENLWALHSKLREDLAIKSDLGLLELCDEGTVRLASILTDSRVQADDPELAEVALLVLAVRKGVAACLHETLVGLLDLG